MKVVFICSGRYNDIQNWSGTVSSMSNVVLDISDEVHFIDNINTNKYLIYLYRVVNKIFNKNMMPNRSIINAKLMAKHINKRIKKLEYDLIFSTSSIPIAYLNSNKPIIFYTDATFENMIDYYENFSNLTKRCINNGNKIELLALKKSSAIIYSSEWAQKSAMEYYNIEPKKIKVVNFGINIKNNLVYEDITKIIEERIKSKRIELLFIGVDFKRKGGDLALKIIKRINDLGYNAVLNIVGNTENIDLKYKQYVKSYGFLNKNNKSDLNKIKELYTKSHFFLLPTRCEAFGIVFSEASSFALPSVTTNTGGVSSVVINNKNGYCFDLNDEEDIYADYIIKLFKNKSEYFNLCNSTFREYKERLNWDVAKEKINSIFEEVIIHEKDI